MIIIKKKVQKNNDDRTLLVGKGNIAWTKKEIETHQDMGRQVADKFILCKEIYIY